ncbi:hypothetical protein [Frigoribacterium sp. Leaf186]|uniref:hypothetical protein n=1 Tax=Frigoribacterium sp. Leaf186 TaxID=1736293 RepID=UPI0007021A53|nr:hypothetical protein [Frigoribacterium sp. Leaf186]KQS22813.1 hypothetical protein ASG05_04800 [Frigoribacterium sp. Leaf186]
MVDREPVPAREPVGPDDDDDYGDDDVAVADGAGAARRDGPDGLEVFDGPGHDESTPAPRSRRLGVVTFVLAVALLALDGLALGLLAADVVGPAAVLALVTLLASIVVGVVALIAVAMRRGRWWGVAALLLSVLANPFVLVRLIGQFVSTV